MEALKRAAEEQMRRPAPDCTATDSSAAKRQKTGQSEEVDRFAYAAADALLAGATGFLATCGFRREKTCTKEAISLLQPLLPPGTNIQLVKLGCRGMVGLLTPDLPQADTVSAVNTLLQQLDKGERQATKSCQRLVPIQATAALSTAAITDAAARLFAWYVSTQAAVPLDRQQQQQQQQQEERPTLKFAVAYKHRGACPTAAAEAEHGQPASFVPPRLSAATAGGNSQPNKQPAEDTAGESASAADRAPAAAAAVQSEASTTSGPAADAAAQVPSADGSAAAEGGAATGAAAAAEALDRGAVIKLLAEKFMAACQGSGGAQVDLHHPEVVVIAEVVPILRQQQVLAMSILPANMVTTKPKLNVRPLGST